MISREYIGRRSSPIEWNIEPGHIRRFAEAIGDPNPIYYEEEAARAAGYPSIPAPPTFAAALRPNDARQGIAIDWGKLLHGGQEFVYHRPIYAGDRLTLVQTIQDVYEKSGKAGTMDFLVLETTGRDAAGEVVFVAQSTVVVKR